MTKDRWSDVLYTAKDRCLDVLDAIAGRRVLRVRVEHEDGTVDYVPARELGQP